MFFRQLWDNASSTFTYLLADESTGETVLIDPVKDNADRDLKLLAELGLELRFVLDTHVHADHVTAAGELGRRTGARTVGGRLGAACADMHLSDGDRVRFGRHELRVLETPGHTDDSVSYLLDDRVFTGDALLVRGCGRTDFQNGNPEQLYRSITRALFTLPEATLIYPAHDYRGFTVSTIGEEKQWNPRLAGKTEEEFVAIMRNLKLGLPAKIMEAVPANRACGLAEVRA